MMHKKRPHTIAEFADLDELCKKLVNHTWTTCSGFRWRSLTLLNDSTSEDAVQEYAVIRNGIQIESLTVSWMESPDVLAGYLVPLDSGEMPGVSFGPVKIIPHPDGYCSRCA